AWRAGTAPASRATTGSPIRASPVARPDDHTGRAGSTSSRAGSLSSLPPTAVRDSVRTSWSLSGSLVPRVLKSLVIVPVRRDRRKHHRVLKDLDRVHPDVREAHRDRAAQRGIERFPQRLDRWIRAIG